MYYYRKAKLCAQRIDKKGRIYYDVLDYLTLNSNSDFTTYFSGYDRQELFLVIENEDNPPLENISIAAYQLNRYLIAHLEAKMDYNLVFGSDGNGAKPNYDINHFKSSVEQTIPVLSTKEIFPILVKEKKLT